MATILNIETSTSLCSVLLDNGTNIYEYAESSVKNAHSAELATLSNNILQKHNIIPDAIAIGIGPGSYTGLRIGLSLAKGLAYRWNIPLIAIPTLKIIASEFLISNPKTTGILCPMLDARRDEVYMAMYNSGLEEIVPQQPFILQNENMNVFNKNKNYVIVGNGAFKMNPYKNKNINIVPESFLSAKGMAGISQNMFINNQWSDTAYTTPEYLKEFEAIKAKNKVLRTGTQFDKKI